MKIFKYQLPVAEHPIVKMHQDALIIRVDGLDGMLWVWAVIDENLPLVERQFHCFKTGGDMPDDILYNYYYLGHCSIFIQQELMLYVWEKVV